VLVVLEREDALTWKSLRNLPSVHLLAPDQLNTYDVLVSDDLVFTQGALKVFLGGEELDIQPAKASKPAKKAAEPKADAEAATEEPAAEAAVEEPAVEATETNEEASE
jgi:large subunit ribosomal protein L4